MPHHHHVQMLLAIAPLLFVQHIRIRLVLPAHRPDLLGLGVHRGGASRRRRLGPGGHLGDLNFGQVGRLGRQIEAFGHVDWVLGRDHLHRSVGVCGYHGGALLRQHFKPHLGRRINQLIEFFIRDQEHNIQKWLILDGISAK